MSRRTVLGLTLLGVLMAGEGVRRTSPLVLWNTTASAPQGIYEVQQPRALTVGDWAVVRPDTRLSNWLSASGYLPSGVPLLKQVAAVQGQTVCRKGAVVTIDGRAAARARPMDHRQRPLPVWGGCLRLDARRVFLLNASPDSLDGRYFGATPVQEVVGRARPLLVRAAS